MQTRTATRTTEIPELPSLEPGIQLLAADDGATRPALGTLVVDHVLTSDADAYWVDTGDHAVTTDLRELAPSDRVLDRIHVARGVTPHQHTSLLRALREEPGFQSADAPLLVVPAVDARYREETGARSGRELLAAALADVAHLQRTANARVLVTRHRDDAFGDPVSALADRTITCRETPHGPRFRGDDFETLVYHLDGDWVQTTLAFWADVLAAREPVYEGTETPTAVTTHGPD